MQEGLSRFAVDFFIKRMKGEVGDILLTNDARLEGLIDDYTDEFFTPKENRWKYKENYHE